MIRIVLVDDQELMRFGLRMILENNDDLTVVGEASDGARAAQLATELQPDVVVMDIRMPGTDGLEATRRIVESGVSSRVLLLTTFDLDEYAFAGLRLGASGFLLKDTPPSDLTAAVRAVAAGDAVVSPRVTRRLLDTIGHHLPQPDAAPDPTNPLLDRLTDREREILVEVGLGLSNAEIAEKLVVSEATVKTHVGRVFAKLEVRDRVQAVVFAFRNGIVRTSDIDSTDSR